MTLLLGLLSLLMFVGYPMLVSARNPASDARPARAAADTIAPGTVITMQNWRQYQQFMPGGMAALFEGKYFWKMPQGVSMEVGPTVIRPLPRSYLEATEKYAGQVRLVELPSGGLTLKNYQGGMPFPNPSEPHKGWKVLANLWYRYQPHLSVNTYGAGCLIDHYGSISCMAAAIVLRQLAYNTDPGIPAKTPGTDDKFYTDWLMVVAPEQEHYTATLDISYENLARNQDNYAFLPALRRYQPVSAAARCSPSYGTDATSEELRSGFESNLTQLKVGLVAEKKILALIDLDLNAPKGKFPENFAMPLGWPTPSWGKWQLRDVYVISMSRLPAYASGYCYGKRVLYVDKQFYAPLWEDLYDMKMQPWKFLALFLKTCNVPGIGPVNSCGADVQSYWDIQNNHATFFIDPYEGHAFYTNADAPQEYTDIVKYTSAPGLDEIMR